MFGDTEMAILVILVNLLVIFLIFQNYFLIKKDKENQKTIYNLEQALIDQENVKVDFDHVDRVFIVSHKDYTRYVPMDNE